MELFLGIIIGLLILMLLVVAHEFGHFLMARKNGVRVNEFGIGFPPRAIAWKKTIVEVKDPKTGKKVKKSKWVRIPKKDWKEKQDSLIFSINWLPIGGFCAMDGESDADTREGTFGASSLKAKTKILFGGVLMNWLFAFFALTILAFFGMPQFLNNQFYLEQDADISGGGIPLIEIVEGKPADQAGLKVDDVVLAVNGNRVLFPADVVDPYVGQSVTYLIRRGDAELEIPVKLNDKNEDLALGVAMGYSETFVRSTWSAPIVGAGLTLQITGETFKGLGTLLWDLVSGVFSQLSPDSSVREQGQAALSEAGDSVSGPVGIVGVLFPAFIKSGAANLTFLTALISISLACMNVIPIPALDGGRWLLILIYRLRGKKLTKETEEKIVSRAMTVLLILIIIITILDIIKLF